MMKIMYMSTFVKTMYGVNIIKEELIMSEKLKQYKYFKKSNSELETDRLINNINCKLWDDNGYNTVLYLGSINQLKLIAEGLGEHGLVGRNEILMLINSFKTNEDVPDEIKNLADMILDEFNYKEATK